MSKYPGRIISATPPTVSLSEASGVWTLEEAAQYQEAGTWPVAVPGIVPDPNFNQTVLLLHGDGTNGAQNNTFLDGSTNNFTITRNGNTTQGTFSPFSVGAGEWSNYFDGTGDSLQLPSSSNLSLGTGDFTVEFWLFPLTVTSTAKAVFSNRTNDGADSVFICSYNTTNGLYFHTQNTAVLNSNDPPVANTWQHVAFVRASGTLKIYLDGVEVGSASLTQNLSSTAAFYIGKDGTRSGGGEASNLDGYISNFRVVKGTAVYTSAFTPPTAPLTAVSNTQLLTCQSNRFVDNSTNAFAITRNGDVRVTPFSPFAPSAAYDPAVNGGSMYSDGSGDNLSIAYDAALDVTQGDFTVEFWVYRTNSGVQLEVINQRGSTIGWLFRINSNNTVICGYAGSGSLAIVTSIGTLPVNEWTHVAAARESNTIRIFLNGVLDNTATGGNGTTSTETFYINRSYLSSGGGVAGWLSDIRVVKGSAVYTAAFTPPTAPLTAITNTSLLTNFTNAGIYDQTGKNVLETVGDAQIDTTTKKYGTGSMEFDGTGDWLLMANTPDQQLGTGNFTIEFWVYLASGDTGSNRGLVAKGGASTGWLVSLNTTEKVVFTYTTSTITSTGSITTNAWNHIAVVREGTGSNQTKIYIGGTNDGTGTVSTDFNQTEVMYVGCNRTAGNPMKGFVDDLRVTKGVARYTGTFTPPTQALSDF